MEKRNILEIASVLTEKNGLGRNAANSFVAEMFAVIQEHLATDKVVKVKGLGTFKLIDVEPRESVSVRTGERVLIAGHSKITFTPDAVIRELVNKPFSQFDTVMLKDGVNFEDVQEEYTPAVSGTDAAGDEAVENVASAEEQIAADAGDEEVAVADEAPAEEEEETAADDENPVEEETIDDVVILDDETAADEDSAGEMEDTATEKTNSDDEPDGGELDIHEDDGGNVNAGDSEDMDDDLDDLDDADDVDDNGEADDVDDEQVLETRPEPHKLLDTGDDQQYPWYKLFMPAVAAVVLAALSAAGGYYVGNRQVSAYDTLVVHDTVIVTDTVLVEPTDTAVDSTSTVAEPAAPVAVEPAAPVAAKPAAPVEAVSSPAAARKPAATVSRPTASENEHNANDYNSDPRLRYGGYRIVGEDRTVTVREGQTFASICRAAFGPDMECYVEAFNGLPRNPNVKAGQVIRIPKLERKHQKRQK